MLCEVLENEFNSVALALCSGALSVTRYFSLLGKYFLLVKTVVSCYLSSTIVSLNPFILAVYSSSHLLILIWFPS